MSSDPKKYLVLIPAFSPGWFIGYHERSGLLCLVKKLGAAALFDDATPLPPCLRSMVAYGVARPCMFSTAEKICGAAQLVK